MISIVKPKKLQLILLCVAGSSFEFFEFAIYSIYALLITKQIMPTALKAESILVWYLVSYGLFFIGYAARPLGGILFGTLSDKISRKKSFIYTMLLMSSATIAIGLIPNFDYIGLAAPIILTLFRLMQGIALGGELPSSTVLLYEHALKKEKIFVVMWFMALTNLGWLSGYLFDSVMRFFLSNQQMQQFGWRLVFIIGGILALLTAVLRNKIMDAEIFNRFKQANKKPAALFRGLFLHYKLALTAGLMIEVLHGATVFLVAVLLNNILQKFYNFTAAKTSHIEIFVIIAWLCFGLISPYIVSKMNKWAVLPFAVFGCSFSLLLLLIPALHPYLILLILFITFFLSIGDGYSPYVVTQLFPIHLRATGFGICYNIGIVIGGILMVLLTAKSIAAGTPILLGFNVIASIFCIYVLFFTAMYFNEKHNTRSVDRTTNEFS